MLGELLEVMSKSGIDNVASVSPNQEPSQLTSLSCLLCFMLSFHSSEPGKKHCLFLAPVIPVNSSYLNNNNYYLLINGCDQMKMTA